MLHDPCGDYEDVCNIVWLWVNLSLLQWLIDLWLIAHYFDVHALKALSLDSFDCLIA